MDTLSIYRDRDRNPDKTETKPIHQRGESERGEIGSRKKDFANACSRMTAS
jgi:hypothetical protein